MKHDLPSSNLDAVFEITPEITPSLTPDLIRQLMNALALGDKNLSKELACPLHPADLADLIALLDYDTRRLLVEALDDDLSGEVLSELEESVRDEVLAWLTPEDVAQALHDLETGDQAYIVENLDESQLKDVLSHMNATDRADLEQILNLPDDVAGRLMRREVIAVPSFWTVGQVLDYSTEMGDEHFPDKFYEVYVVDPSFKPVGSVALSDLLRSKRTRKISEITDYDIDRILVTATQDEVIYQFEQYSLVSTPVVDLYGRLIGVILVDDVVELIQEQADHNIKQMAGVGGEDLNDPLHRVVYNRWVWLFVNLWTAILAAVIIDGFSSTIEKYVILAAMGPLVASMGGNAGSQSLTVTVRGLATRTLTITNRKRIIHKEILIGVINGLAFAAIILCITFIGAELKLWTMDLKMSMIIAVAMFVQLCMATLSGVLLPLILKACRIDPAVSGVVFLTTITDTVGFFSVLGLAKWLL
jgi:magnesium transporter